MRQWPRSAAHALGVPVDTALRAAASVGEVAGRFAEVVHRGVRARLLLAKNPAGWAELIGLVEADGRAVVIGINSRLADGHDPSWLWDVPFERLAGRFVVATGERRLDLAVRLRHAGVDHVVEVDQLRALELPGEPTVDYVGNYTAFQALRKRLAMTSFARLRPRAPVPTAPLRSLPRPVLAHQASPLSVVVVHPDLLGTYGDVGNGRVLADRAEWRGIPVELVFARSNDPLPALGDIYCLGGGEDGPQSQSADRLRAGALVTAVNEARPSSLSVRDSRSSGVPSRDPAEHTMASGSSTSSPSTPPSGAPSGRSSQKRSPIRRGRSLQGR